jgi:hypothetical protein
MQAYATTPVIPPSAGLQRCFLHREAAFTGPDKDKITCWDSYLKGVSTSQCSAAVDWFRTNCSPRGARSLGLSKTLLAAKGTAACSAGAMLFYLDTSVPQA